MNKTEYDICKVRKHQKSGLKVGDWDVCEFCKIKFRYVVKLEEDSAEV